MGSYSLYFSVSAFCHLKKMFRNLSMLLHLSIICSFVIAELYSLYEHSTISLSFVGEHLGCAPSIELWWMRHGIIISVFLGAGIFISLEDISRQVFLVHNLDVCLALLEQEKQLTKVVVTFFYCLFAIDNVQAFQLPHTLAKIWCNRHFDFWLHGHKWYFIVVPRCVSLTTNDVEPLLM